MIKVYRGYTELTNYILSNPYKDTLDEELDRASFQIKTTSKLTDLMKYEKFTYEITQGTSNNIMLSKTLALFDYVETYECEYWLYQITLISPTKILENIIINGMAETYCPSNNQSLYQQLVRVADKINAQLSYEMSGMTTPFNIAIDTNLNSSLNANYIGNVASNDFIWDGQNTLREIFQDMLDKADMLVVCDGYSYENGKITYLHLTAVKREKRGTQLASGTSIEGGGLNAIKSVIKGISIHRDSEFNSGNIVSLTKNAICNGEVKSAYMPARNDDMTIDDKADWHIITQEPIYTLNKVVAMMPILTRLYYWKYENNAWTEKYYVRDYNPNYDTLYLPVDITEYIVEKDVYDVLPVSEQKKRLYFKRGEKGIYGLYKLYKNSPLWSTTAMYNIATKIFKDDLNNAGDILFYTNDNGVVSWADYNNPKLLKLVDDTPVFLNLTTDNVNIHISSSGNKEDGAISRFQCMQYPVSSDMPYSLFSANYQPYADAVVKIEKQTMTKGNVKNLCVLKNQSDRTIDAEKYYKSQQALINRLGEEEMTIDCEFKMAENPTLWQLGDYITLDSKNWTLTEREFEINGKDYIKARMTFSKNYNARNSAINMNRDKRLYGIPLNQYVDRYIIYNLPYSPDNFKLLVESWDDFTDDTTTHGYTLLDLIKLYDNYCVARCKDNYAVDIERTKHSGTIVNVNLRYCDEDTGYKDNINLRVVSNASFNEYNVADYSRLPFIPNYIDPNATSIQLTGIKKDKMERLIFILKN